MWIRPADTFDKSLTMLFQVINSQEGSSGCKIFKCTNVKEELNIPFGYWWLETNFDLMTNLVFMKTVQRGQISLRI